MENQQEAPKGVAAMPAKDVPPARLLRIKREIAEFNADPLPGIFIAPEENDITNINAIVMGAKGTPLEGGFFHFYVQYTNLYPLEPPKVRSMTTDAGRVQFNEHIYKCVSICLSRLNTFGSTWTPAQTLSSLLLSIQWLLCDVQKLKDKATLKDVVLENFIELYHMYEGAVKSMLHLTGTQMNDPAGFNSGIYQFEKLLRRLQELKLRVAEKKEAPAVMADM
ncbi:hypothetical protein MTO96_043885 [Rhipicephalus appendiculatus]